MSNLVLRDASASKKGKRDTIRSHKNTSVCCSGYYIKVAQISCQPPRPRPRLQRWKVYRRPAVSCHPYAVHPGALLTVILDTDRLYLSVLFAFICLEERHLVCDICLPAGLQQWWQVILLTPTPSCAHRSLSFDTRLASNTDSRWKTVEKWIKGISSLHLDKIVVYASH